MKNFEEKFVDWARIKLGDDIEVMKEKYGDQSTVYHIYASHANYFLKIAPNLSAEREKLDWLYGKLPVPKVVGFTQIKDKDALLLSAISGKNLAELKKEWPVEKIINALIKALLRFHTVDIKNCPFGSFGPDKILVHGDACLSNFIFQGDVFSGYVDLGDARIDVPEVDLSAAIWSLQYNLGPGYGLKFLEKYGVKDATEESVEKLRLQYEDMQKEWGLL